MRQQNVSKILFNLPFVLLINGFPLSDIELGSYFLITTMFSARKIYSYGYKYISL